MRSRLSLHLGVPYSSRAALLGCEGERRGGEAGRLDDTPTPRSGGFPYAEPLQGVSARSSRASTPESPGTPPATEPASSASAWTARHSAPTEVGRWPSTSRTTTPPAYSGKPRRAYERMLSAVRVSSGEGMMARLDQRCPRCGGLCSWRRDAGRRSDYDRPGGCASEDTAHAPFTEERPLAAVRAGWLLQAARASAATARSPPTGRPGPL